MFNFEKIREMENEMGGGGPSPSENTETPNPEGNAPSSWEWNEDRINALPEEYRPHVNELVEANSKYKEMSEKLGDSSLDDLFGYRDTLNNYGSFMEQNGIGEEEFNGFLDIMAGLQKDPEAAVAQMQQFMEDIQVQRGLKLPADLEQSVKEGKVTPELAAEVAKGRLDQKSREQLEQKQQREAQDKAINTAVSEVQTILQKYNMQGNKDAAQLVVDSVGPWLEKSNYQYDPKELAQRVERCLKPFQTSNPSQQGNENEGNSDALKVLESKDFYRNASPEHQAFLRRAWNV